MSLSCYFKQIWQNTLLVYLQAAQITVGWFWKDGCGLHRKTTIDSGTCFYCLAATTLNMSGNFLSKIETWHFCEKTYFLQCITFPLLPYIVAMAEFFILFRN